MYQPRAGAVGYSTIEWIWLEEITSDNGAKTHDELCFAQYAGPARSWQLGDTTSHWGKILDHSLMQVAKCRWQGTGRSTSFLPKLMFNWLPIADFTHKQTCTPTSRPTSTRRVLASATTGSRSSRAVKDAPSHHHPAFDTASSHTSAVSVPHTIRALPTKSTSDER